MIQQLNNYVGVDMIKSKTYTPGEIKYQCTICKDIIWSKYEGQFTTCKCGAISVDQTAYYTRILGDIEKTVRINDS